LQIIAAIVDPQVMIHMLTHLDLPAPRIGALLHAIPSGVTLNTTRLA